LSLYQFFAASLAIVLVVGWVVLVLRYRWWGVAVVSALTLWLPAVGFAVYALTPGQPPADAVVLYLVALVYLAVIVAAAMRFRVGRKRGPKPLIYASASETRRFQRVGGRALLVLSLSSLVFLAEPGIAVANLALNAAWMAVWIPRRCRTRQVENSVVVSVAPERAFEFVTNLKNWPLYHDDLELVEVTPDGPLAIGSEYVARTAIPQALQDSSHRQIETRNRVIAMVPGSSYTVTWSDEPGWVSRTDFVQVDSGTRITNKRTMTVSFPQASEGVMLNLPRALAAARVADERRNARLKEVLEQAR
jgi:hypothetical protein